LFTCKCRSIFVPKLFTEKVLSKMEKSGYASFSKNKRTIRWPHSWISFWRRHVKPRDSQVLLGTRYPDFRRIRFDRNISYYYCKSNDSRQSRNSWKGIAEFRSKDC